MTYLNFKYVLFPSLHEVGKVTNTIRYFIVSVLFHQGFCRACRCSILDYYPTSCEAS